MQATTAGIKSYLIVNLVLAGSIGLIFVYSGIFSAEKDNYPLPSFFEEITGEVPPSAGMSRAFSELVRGNFGAASAYNPDSPLIFAFFLIQFIQRTAVTFLLLKEARTGSKPLVRMSHPTIKYLLPIDVIASMILFIFCFRGQIQAMLELFME